MKTVIISLIAISFVLSMIVIMCALFIGGAEDKYMTDKEREYYDMEQINALKEQQAKKQAKKERRKSWM